MFEELKIIFWPDPRLKKVSKPVTDFEQILRALSARMLELMREAKGVGLAAPQVGLNIRLFVMNATGQPADDRVYVNPVLSDPQGDAEAEEGCLSIPGITAAVLRTEQMRVTATDLDGNAFEETAGGLTARVWQHEIDHLNGTLITDRVGPVARMANRKILKELEDKYAALHPPRKSHRQRKLK